MPTECSLFGVVSHVDTMWSREHKYREYSRVEYLYTQKQQRIYIHEERSVRDGSNREGSVRNGSNRDSTTNINTNSSLFTIAYDNVDRNKQRSVLSRDIEKYQVTPEIFSMLSENGYERKKEREYRIIEYEINGYKVEYSIKERDSKGRDYKERDYKERDTKERDTKGRDSKEGTNEFSNEFTNDISNISDISTNDSAILVRAYCFVSDVLEGEQILSRTYEDLGIKMTYDTEIFM